MDTTSDFELSSAVPDGDVTDGAIQESSTDNDDIQRTKEGDHSNVPDAQPKPQNKPVVKEPRNIFYRLYTLVSTSVLLENKGSVARDHLANERTYLAWLRTSLSIITVGVAITQLFRLSSPDTTKHQAGKPLGACFIFLGIVFLLFALARYFHIQVALKQELFPASRGIVVMGTVMTLGLLIATLIVIVVVS